VRSWERQQHAAATLWACGQNGPRASYRVTLGKGSGAGAPCSRRARPAGRRSLLSGGAHSGSRGARASSLALVRRVSLSRMRDSASRRRRRGGFGLKAYSYWPYAACSILPLATLLPLSRSLARSLARLGPIMMLMMMVF
jgi:hypothetical protein